MGKNGNSGEKCLLLVVNGVNSGLIRDQGSGVRSMAYAKSEVKRRGKFLCLLLLLVLLCYLTYTLPFHAPPRPCQCCNAESNVIQVYIKEIMGKLKAKAEEHL
jgi:hypothetical protein